MGQNVSWFVSFFWRLFGLQPIEPRLEKTNHEYKGGHEAPKTIFHIPFWAAFSLVIWSGARKEILQFLKNILLNNASKRTSRNIIFMLQVMLDPYI